MDSIDALELALAVSKTYGFQLRSDDKENRRVFASLRALSQHIEPVSYTHLDVYKRQDLDPAEIERAQAAHDPAALPSYRLAALAAEGYPQVMRGAATGEAMLFAADRISAWSDYFSNQNPLYAISNQIGARAVLERFPHPRGTVLEIGGGGGSGAMALLDSFAAAGATDRIERCLLYTSRCV